ncbi:MAG: beta-lactamase family protein [Bacteroides sp.]|nr:beta-lactamase family protein [Bacillota bacterium]MCM1394270.1 beta-lactamase family protein [[Eubacterium] siraeum]MCM1455786.1 beta-lactamase family protein [Bacteroides sp.]
MKTFKSVKLLCLIICLFVVFGGALIINQNKSVAVADDIGGIYADIDAYLSDACKKAHFPAMSVTIVDKNSVLFSMTYGDYISTDTPFLLGSVSKSFTALCVMQLAEQGKIDLNEKLAYYLPDATDGDRITILQLLNHSGGLGEHQNLSNYKIVGKQGVHQYANVNYSLLGKVIEAVSGTSYEEYVAKNVFEPLSMHKSAATYEQAKQNGLIDGYENWFGVNTKTKPKYPKSDDAWITVPAGYLSSSTADLGRYLQMYLNGGEGIISQESIDQMFYNGVEVKGDIPYKYTMGWTLTNEPLTQPALRHSGLVETGMSAIYILPESGIGIAVAVNTNDYFVGKDMMDRIDWSIALMLMGEKPNEIGKSEYLTRHFLYDLAYFAFFAVSILPLCLMGVFKKRLAKGRLSIKIVLLVLLHLILPIIILLLPIMFFATPLWVVQAFVPDMFTAIIVSSCLLFIGGITKSILLISDKVKRKTKCI